MLLFSILILLAAYHLEHPTNVTIREFLHCFIGIFRPKFDSCVGILYLESGFNILKAAIYTLEISRVPDKVRTKEAIPREISAAGKFNPVPDWWTVI